jgi:hypothetical protein
VRKANGTVRCWDSLLSVFFPLAVEGVPADAEPARRRRDVAAALSIALRIATISSWSRLAASIAEEAIESSISD